MDLGKMGELKKMYDKYKELQKALKNLVIRAKEWEYTDEDWEKKSSIIIDMTWEMKVRDFKVNKKLDKTCTFLHFFREQGRVWGCYV